MYRAILVPLDGSPFGEHALPLALQAARRSGAHLHLVHAHTLDGRRGDDTTRESQHYKHEQEYLAGVVGRLASSWQGPIETALLDGAVAESIAVYAEARGIDLVVLATHGRGVLSRAWLGSVADRLLHRLPMPVVVVRPHEAEPADIARAPHLSHVLIPLDGSELSEGIIPHALALGRLTGAAYTLIQVVELPVAEYPFGGYVFSAQEIDAWVGRAWRYLDRLAAPLKAEGLQVTTQVTIGWPVMTILDYAADHAVDLIALATHGRSGAPRLFLGSVADKIVRSAEVPVLLYRPTGEPTSPS